MLGKWIKHTLLTSIHFSHHSNLDQSQRCFRSSRNPNSGRRSVPASPGNQSLFLVVLNEFLKRRSTSSFLSVFPKCSCSQSAVKHSGSQLIFSFTCVFDLRSISWMPARGGCRWPQSLMYPADSPERHKAPRQVVF